MVEGRSQPTSPPLVHLTWAKGGHAEITRVEGEAIELRSTTPSPPGARVEGMLAGEAPTPLKIKSYGTRREADGSFFFRGRLLEATRELRDRLVRIATGS